MTSRPLFIIEAESMVIFCPMLQLGCLSACASVACSISDTAQVRNGPPEAVMMTRTSSSRLPDDSAWNRALCSESAGREAGAGRGGRGQEAGAGLGGALHEEIAGTNETFLVGEGHGRTAVDGGQRRLQAGSTGHR